MVSVPLRGICFLILSPGSLVAAGLKKRFAEPRHRGEILRAIGSAKVPPSRATVGAELISTLDDNEPIRIKLGFTPPGHYRRSAIDQVNTQRVFLLIDAARRSF